MFTNPLSLILLVRNSSRDKRYFVLPLTFNGISSYYHAMAKTLRYRPKFDPLKDLLLDMAKERSCEAVLTTIVGRLSRGSQVALCRVWLTLPGDRCETCPMRTECPDQTRCLHLVASAGSSTAEKGLVWDQIDGASGRIPIGARKIGRIAESGESQEALEIDPEQDWVRDPDWIRREGVRGFGGQPLIHNGEVLGVLAIFTRMPLEEEWLTWLRMIADHAAAAIANSRAFEEIDRLRDQLALENTFLRQEIAETLDFGDLIGNSPAIAQLSRQIDLVAPTEASILILGESGTGKELVAREIHRRSRRGDRPLIKVNCASIPGELFESEFFGHVRGAFTGAVRDRAGRFEAAEGGTIFLDEVGEIPLELQGKLLRVLQEGEYERVGEERTRRTNVRIVAATNRDLKQAVANGQFREDLYFRLNVFPLEVAPLRDRKEDIPLLASHFLQCAIIDLKRDPLKLSQAAVDRLQSYDWPGNVRELQNVIERAAITSPGDTLRLDLVAATIAPPRIVAHTDTIANDGVLTEAQMIELDKKNLQTALDRTGWKIYGSGGTAELLGLRPTTLASRIKKYGLAKPSA